MENNAFSASEALAGLVRSQGESTGPKLSFTDKCSAFCALKANVKTSTVAKAFGITFATASNLKGASRLGRYREVAREYEHLGDETFREKYYTDDVHTRLMRVKHKVEQATDDRRAGAPNPKADKFSYKKIGPVNVGGQLWKIGLVNSEDNSGWVFVQCDEFCERFRNENGTSVHRNRGQECLKEKPDHHPCEPFRTSGEAYSGLCAYTETPDRTADEYAFGGRGQWTIDECIGVNTDYPMEKITIDKDHNKD